MENHSYLANDGTSNPSLCLAASVSASISLNFDIIDYMLRFLPQSDLLSIMLASRVLYSAALRHLLSERRVYPVGQVRTRLFCDFLLKDSTYRCGMLRRLKINVTTMPRGDVREIPRIADVLSHAQQLKELEMSTNGPTLDAKPDFGRCLIRLERLRCFTLESFHVIPAVYELIAQRVAPFTRLHVIFEIPSAELWDASTLLAPSAQVLEMVALSSVAFVDTNAQYHRVRELHIEFIAVSYDTGKLMHMFPNLQALHFLPSYILFDRTAEELRARNKHADTDSRWSSLSYFAGPSPDMYAAGLVCKVDHLEVHLGVCSVKQVLEMIEVAMPRHLTLYVHIQNHYAQVLRACAAALRELTLHITMQNDIRNTWDPLRDGIFPALEHTHMTDLSISMSFLKVYCGGGNNFPNARNLFRTIDVGSLVHEVTELVPSLRHVALELPYNSKSEWEITTCGSDELVYECVMWKPWEDDRYRS